MLILLVLHRSTACSIGFLPDEEKNKQNKTKIQTSDASEGKAKSVRHAYVHKPYLYSKYYSDSDDELTVEQRRQSIVSRTRSAAVLTCSAGLTYLASLCARYWAAHQPDTLVLPSGTCHLKRQTRRKHGT